MSVASQMSLEQQSYVGGDDQMFEYRPYPTLVPISLAFVFLSFSAMLWDALTVVPLVGAVLGVICWRQVRASNGTLGGGWIALSAGLVQVVLFLGFATLHIHSYTTEVPEGYTRISFTSDISKKGIPIVNGLPQIHPDVKELAGKKVMIKGYMYPTKKMHGITEFVLCRDNGDCCFGGQPKVTDMIQIRMKNNQTVRFFDNKVLIAVSGTFKPEPTVDETGLTPVYQLDCDIFAQAKTLY